MSRMYDRIVRLGRDRTNTKDGENLKMTKRICVCCGKELTKEIFEEMKTELATIGLEDLLPYALTQVGDNDD